MSFNICSSSLWKVMICVFTFSHGQGQIEHDFSINKSLLVENMHEKSICAQQLVSDFVNSLNKEWKWHVFGKAKAIRKSISSKQELIKKLDLAIKELEEEKKTLK